MSSTWVLSESPRLRFAACCLLYFAQGLPFGLQGIAVPTWLAAKGVPPSAIATYLAVIILPWAFKLVSGPLMDRFEYLHMGRRRPWVLAAQAGLTISMLSMCLLDDITEQLALLTLCALLVNCFAATQDVAVDGMAIELVPANEQGRLNAFMSFGKTIGWASSAAASGSILVTWGLPVAALLAALLAGLIFLVFLFVVERPGERILPWTQGQAATEHVKARSFSQVFAGLNRVMWSRISLAMIAIMFLDGLVGGYGQALMPIAAVKLFGYTTPQWSNLVATMGFLGAGLALVAGPLIDRFGARRLLLSTVVFSAAHAFTLAATQAWWQNNTYVLIMLSVWVLLGPMAMVCALALAMAICDETVSATQFAVYMSIANFGTSAGAKLFGTVAESVSYVQNYAFLGVLLLASLLTILFYRINHGEVITNS